MYSTPDGNIRTNVRWSGSLVPGYDPGKDPENQELCNICDGTGLRKDELGIEMRKKDPEFTCNGCNGDGKKEKWPTQWKQFNGDILPTELVPKDLVPYAIVTPDGVWNQRGKMGWWGVSSNEDDDWDEKAKKIIDEHRHKTHAIVVDAHI